MDQSLNQILEIIVNDHFQGVNARNLHQALKVGRDFSTWIKSRLKGANFIEEQDFIIVQDLAIGSPKRGNQKGGNKKTTFDYILSIDTAKHICLMERNEIGQAIRQHFINAERALKQYAPKVHRNTLQATMQRLASIDYNHLMTEALQKHLIRQGKQPQAHHFINEQNLINSLVIGGNFKEWKAGKGIKGNARDYFNDEQLSILVELEKVNTALLEIDIDCTARKKQLIALAQRLQRDHSK